MAKEKELMKGLDFVNDVRLKIHVEESNTIIEILIDQLVKFFDGITPLKSQIKHIEGTQTKSIHSFFVFFRRLVTVGIFQTVIFAPFFFFNLVGQVQEDPTFLYTLCPAFLGLQMPCGIMYSRIAFQMRILFPLTFVTFGTYRLYVALKNLIAFTSERYREKYDNEDGKFKLSQMLFNCWEFKIDN